MAWDSKDTALTIQGVGSLASAWGQYKTDKKRNELLENQLNYEKEKDALATAKMDTAQNALDDAFSDFLNKKKKKYDANGNEIVEDTILTA